MKMKHITLMIMALALVMAMAPTAHAACNPPTTFHSWDFGGAGYAYVYGWHGNVSSTSGAFWKPGQRATANEGSFGVSNWLRSSIYGDYLTGNLGDGATVGCVNGQIIVLLTQDNGDGTASFAMARENERAASPQFHMPNMTFAPIPRPRVVNASRAGAAMVVDVAFDGLPAAGVGFNSRTGHTAAATIANWVLLSSHGASDSGRPTGAWSEVGRQAYSDAGATMTGLTVGCADDGGDTFLAVGLDVAGDLVSLHVGASTALECDPTLADPDDKFDLIRDRGQGRKKGRPFNR